MKIQKTNAARILDRLNIPYKLVAYEVDENDLSAIHLASQLNQPIDLVYKTILLRGDKTGVFACIVPGAFEVNLKKAASISGNKYAETVAMKELLPLTGYIRGGCSPLGMKKLYPIFFHQLATQYPLIFVSGGLRGLQLQLSPSDLQQAVNAVFCDLI
jgi:Cys-tRNA(Pro)/Cys-tRNA(Cys) deacylase